MSLAVIIGEEATFDARFLTFEGIPVDPSASPEYRIIDNEGNFILSGSGTQDATAPERWVATLMIPSGADATEQADEFYTINWRLISVNGQVYNFSEKFKVYTGLAEDEPPMEALFGIEGMEHVTDTLVTDRIPSKILLRRIDPIMQGSDRTTEWEEVTVPAPTRHERSNYYFSLDVYVGDIQYSVNGIEELQVMWQIEFPDGEKITEIRPLYLASSFAMKIVFDVRQQADKGQQWHLNKSLNISDWEILFSILQAVNRINAFSPITEWGLTSIPRQLYYFLTGYAVVELLRQLYLAYGMAAFDFQGQSTQLTMDPTQFIQTIMDNLENSLNERMIAAKKQMVRQTRPIGVGSVNIGPGTNYPVMMDSYGYLAFRLRSYLFRSIF